MFYFILLNIIIVLLFASIYFYIEWKKENFKETPSIKKALFHSISNHFPFLDNDIPDNSMTSKILKGSQNVISKVLIYSSLF